MGVPNLRDSGSESCDSDNASSENAITENATAQHSHLPQLLIPFEPKLTNRTGADILAPSIGNLHGSYKFLPGGPSFDWSILEDLHRRFGGSPDGPYLCMHGTDELSDEFFRRIVKCGVSKINVNSWLREPYVSTLSKSLQSKTMPEAIDDAHEAMVKEAERFCDLLGSTGKA